MDNCFDSKIVYKIMLKGQRDKYIYDLLWTGVLCGGGAVLGTAGVEPCMASAHGCSGSPRVAPQCRAPLSHAPTALVQPFML